MNNKLLCYCPRCGCTQLDVETEPGQFNLLCMRCSFSCEIIVFDEGEEKD